MATIADILLAAGALGAGFYCFILGQRLRKFTDLEKGVGGAVAVLSAQVDDLSKSLEDAKSTANGSVATLNDAANRAEAAGRQLELLMAAMHDLPDTRKAAPPAANPFFVRKPGGTEAH